MADFSAESESPEATVPLSNGPEDTAATLVARDERLEALKAVAGKLAHDFNNFLVPFLGYISLIQQEIPADSTARGFLASMEKAARLTETSLETMLLAVRPQRIFSPKRFSLHRVVEEAIDVFKQEISGSAAVVVSTELEPLDVEGDIRHWKPTVDHLLRNARFALAMGGTLHVSLRRRAVGESDAVRYSLRGFDIFELKVTDSGIGMPRSVCQRAIEPFFTTRPKGQAMGLGLTVAHSVVKLHGGQLLIDSEEDRGTEVTLLVPVAPPPVAPGSLTAVRATTARPTQPGGKVLLVEDEPLVREVIKTYLERLQMNVVPAQNGVEGLRLFKRYARDLSLVVSDITMPEMDGIEMCRQIRALDPNLPVILITGNAVPLREDALAHFEPNPPPVLRKPITLKAFSESVRQHIDLHEPPS